MSLSIQFYSALDIDTLRSELEKQRAAIRDIVAAGQECPDATRDLERKKARLDFLMAERVKDSLVPA